MITKTVHFIWLGSDVPMKYLENIANWEAKNPTYSIYLWVDTLLFPAPYRHVGLSNTRRYLACSKVAIRDLATADDLRSTVYLKETAQQPRSQTQIQAPTRGDANWGAASDVLRVAILLKHGGLYVDTDIQCTGPLDIRIASSESPILVRLEEGESISNNIIAGPPGSPYLQRYAVRQSEYMNAMYDNPQQLHLYNTDRGTNESARSQLTIANTGPQALGQAIIDIDGFKNFNPKRIEVPTTNLVIGYDHSWF